MLHRKTLAAMGTAVAMMIAGPALATCMVQAQTPQGGLKIKLVSPAGKTVLWRVTGSSGQLILNGLSPGEWLVSRAGQQRPQVMVVAKDRRLVIMATSVTVTCSPPGGPSTTSTSVQIKQANPPA